MTTKNKKMSEVLKEALALFGPNGEHWAKDFYAFDKDGNKVSAVHESACKFCSSGALAVANNDMFRPHLACETLMNKVVSLLTGEFRTHIISLNDADETTFEDVRLVFKTAIDIAEMVERFNG